MIPGVNLFTGIFTTGYVLDLMKNPSIAELPKWEHIWRLFVEGLKGFIVSLVWFIPAIIVGLLVFGKALFTTGAFVSSIGVFGIILVMLVFAVTAYVVPVGLLEYVRSRSIRSAIDVRRLVKRAWRKAYLTQWLLAMALYVSVNLVIGGIAFGLSFFSTVGAFLTVVVTGYSSFIVAVMSFVLLGFAASNGTRPSTNRLKNNNTSTKRVTTKKTRRK